MINSQYARKTLSKLVNAQLAKARFWPHTILSQI